jgi:hypothetical protein
MSQTAWAGVYRNWTWMGVPVMLIALAALALLIAGVTSLIKKAQMFRVPLADNQEVHFTRIGRVVLCAEGPRGTTRFVNVNFELTGMDGERIEGRRVWFSTRTSAISKVRMELLSYNIPYPGRYVLHMTGLGAPQEKDASHAVVFAEPHLGQTVAYILGIVLVSGVFITSLVFFLMRLLEKGPET